MRHKHGNRILGRTADKRRHLFQSLTSSLLLHGSITTTEAKAKELRRFFEPMVTKAKRGEMLPIRRALLADLLHKTDLPRLYAVAKVNQTRPGGYLRLTKLPTKRMDDARMVRIDIMNVA